MLAKHVRTDEANEERRGEGGSDKEISWCLKENWNLRFPET